MFCGLPDASRSSAPPSVSLVGLAIDAFLGKLLADWMHSTFAADSLLSAAALLALSALLACFLPARRATTVPPAEALRYE